MVGTAHGDIWDPTVWRTARNTFGSDYPGSGFHTSALLFGPNTSYAVRFPVAGEFQVYCIIHPGMKGTVTVVDDPTESPTQGAIDVQGEADYDREIAALKVQAEAWANRDIERTVLSDGTMEHTVYIAGETPKGDVQAFFPPTLDVETGDTVRWRSTTVTEHTVTFGPFPQGIPRAGNPAVDQRAVPGDEYRGTGFWNSGMMGVESPVGVEFEMKFATAGRFFYYCIPHADQGMGGTIVVSDRSGPPPTPVASQTPLPPATGRGTDGGAGTGVWYLVAAIAGLLSIGTVAGMAGRTRGS